MRPISDIPEWSRPATVHTVLASGGQRRSHDLVPIHHVSGGYNAVFQMSARACARRLSDALYREERLPVEEVELRRTAADSQGVHSPALRELPSSSGHHGMWITVALASLEFVGPSSVRLVFDVTFQLRELDTAWRWVAPGVRRAASASGLGGAAIDVTHLRELVGAVEVQVIAPYRAELDRDTATVRVVAESSGASTELRGYVLDAELVVRELLPSNGLEQYLPLREIDLVPTLALHGPGPGSADALGWPRFDAAVFHLDAAQGHALVVAYDLTEGCRGIHDEVQHFLGGADYGLISDERVIEGVLKHKWAMGGFFREVPLSRGLRLSRDGESVDATLHGTLALRSLEIVAIETDANAGLDVIRLGGTATVQATGITSDAGETIGPGDFDLGLARALPWGVRTIPVLEREIPPSAAADAFERAAHRDAYHWLARPFAHATADDDAIDVSYSRLQAITKQLYVLGNFNSFPQP